MLNKTSPILKQLLWLFISFGITLLLSAAIISNNTVDIQLYDTYFVLPVWLFFIPLFSLLIFVGYFVSEMPKSFNRTLPNWLIVVSGLILILALRYLVRNLDQLSHAGKSGWVIYPPLSALKNSELPWTKRPDLSLVINILTGIQVIFFAMVLYVTYQWRASKRNSLY